MQSRGLGANWNVSGKVGIKLALRRRILPSIRKNEGHTGYW